MMKKLILLLLVALLAMQASALVVDFDFNKDGSATEAGFIGVAAGHNSSYVRWDLTGAIIDPFADPDSQGIVFTASQDDGVDSGVVWSYDWATGTDLGTDGYYGSNVTVFGITAHNLPAGTHNFITYHGQNWSTDGTIDVFVDGSLVVDDLLMGSTAAPASAIFSIVSDGVSDYLIEFDAGPGGNGYTFINGMSIVPEPATMMLLGLGGVFLRRRK